MLWGEKPYIAQKRTFQQRETEKQRLVNLMQHGEKQENGKEKQRSSRLVLQTEIFRALIKINTKVLFNSVIVE